MHLKHVLWKCFPWKTLYLTPSEIASLQIKHLGAWYVWHLWHWKAPSGLVKNPAPTNDVSQKLKVHNKDFYFIFPKQFTSSRLKRSCLLANKTFIVIIIIFI